MFSWFLCILKRIPKQLLLRYGVQYEIINYSITFTKYLKPNYTVGLYHRGYYCRGIYL